MSAEELSRILLWILSGATTAFGLATPEALLNLLQPEILGAAMFVAAAIWRVFRPPVVKAAE